MKDTWLVWNVKMQDWLLYEAHGHSFCRDCEDTNTVENKNLSGKST